jgi:hypothetical protein
MLEITDREALLMSQVLFTLRTSSQILVSSHQQDEILDLVDKIEEHLAPFVPASQKEDLAAMSQYDDVDESEEEEDPNAVRQYVGDFLDLDAVSVTEDSEKKKFAFVSGPDGVLDVELGTGKEEEIICCIKQISRSQKSFEIVTVDGDTREFFVNKFPKSWTSALPVNTLIYVEEEE